jgi:hypothetical protein
MTVTTKLLREARTAALHSASRTTACVCIEPACEWHDVEANTARLDALFNALDAEILRREIAAGTWESCKCGGNHPAGWPDKKCAGRA